MNTFFIILIVVVLLILLIFNIWNFKKIKISNVFLVSGGVKTGKSFCSVWLAIKQYRCQVRKYYIKRFMAFLVLGLFQRYIKRDKQLWLNYLATAQKPVLYSNINLRNINYSLLDLSILTRDARIPYGSVAILDEVSLFADSMSYKLDNKTNNLNEKLLLMIKLWGHATRGGYLFLNTQSISDCHYAFKRSISSYLWIHSKTKFPFFTILRVREKVYSDDGSDVNISNDDLEETLKWVLIPNKYFKYYDCFCYSILTDDKPIHIHLRKNGKKDSLKQKFILSFKEWKNIPNDNKESEVLENERK